MHEVVKNYYGNTLKSSEDLQTNACCTDDNLSEELKNILANIHDDVMARYYGCGLVTPELLKGCSVLDLGCGSGRDCYAVAQMVGESGFVTGVDMTDEQLAVANKHIEYHRTQFGYEKANTAFLKGYIEQLDKLNIADNSVDAVISNCVINLAPNKRAVLNQVYRILKTGGEMYFSDVYANKRVPTHLKEDPLLYGECLSGALYWNDFENLAKSIGFSEPRIVSSRAISIDNKKLAAQLEELKFTAITYRLFKIEGLEADPQDYNQIITYLGSIKDHPTQFSLDKTCHFITGKPTKVSGNTWRTLVQSRFKQHFTFEGDFTQHQGLFQEGKPRLDFLKQAYETLNSSGCTPNKPVVDKKSCCE